MSPKEYQQYVQQKSQKSPIVKDVVLAFIIGGLICVVGQLIQNGWSAAGLDKENAGAATSICMVLLSALLTGFNLYNKLARFGGAGTLVPITGFGVPGHRLQERGLCHRHGGEDVPGGRTGDRVRHPGVGDLRRGFDAVRAGMKGRDALRRVSFFTAPAVSPGPAARGEALAALPTP